jgi:hypothetical protein
LPGILSVDFSLRGFLEKSVQFGAVVEKPVPRCHQFPGFFNSSRAPKVPCLSYTKAKTMKFDNGKLIHFLAFSGTKRRQPGDSQEKPVYVPRPLRILSIAVIRTNPSAK